MIINLRERKKTKFTRMCIGEAIIILLKDQELSNLKISAIVKKAGVSRMSFYRYYTSVYEALKDYLQIIVEEYLEESHAIEERTTWFEYQHIQFSLEFFDRYRDFFLVMSKRGLHSILMEGVNQLMEEQFHPEKSLSVYEMYSYAGGLLNCFLMWEKRGKKEPVSDVAMIIYKLYHAKEQDR